MAVKKSSVRGVASRNVLSPAASRQGNSIPHTQALKLLLAAEAAQGHNEAVLLELPAIITHWLQYPKQEPSVLGPEAALRWKAVLAAYVRSNSRPVSEILDGKNKTAYEISYDDLPFPPVAKPKFKFIDLFAGIGGFRLALQGLGGKCVFSSEWERHAKETYFENFGEIPFGDIKNFTSAEGVQPLHQGLIPRHDILAAGFPCQAFSQAGRQLGFNEARGTLFFEILKIAKMHRPPVLLLENVKRLKTHDKGRTFSVIVNSLRELGYKVYAKVLRAYDFGLPQNRERIFIVAFDQPIHFEFPEPLLDLKDVCVGGILEEAVDHWYTISDKIYDGHKRRLREHRARGNGFGFSIFSPDAAYTNTISARYWKDGSEILIDQGVSNPRMLTPRECARLQGFPDSFITNASRRHAYQQFGNSVPVSVVARVGEAILAALQAKRKVKSIDALQPVIL